MIWLLLLPAYALGTFPSAVMVARSKGIDITQVGSGNPGASNIARTLGTKWGVAVFVLDGLKGVLPATVGLLVQHNALAWGMAGAAMLGHVFPITRRFQGGKGVATMAGAALVVQPLVTAILAAVWYAVRKLSRTASIASLTIMVLFPIGVALRGGPAWEILEIVAIVLVVLVRHTGNVKRILTGSELRSQRSL